jgi:malic enzyme
VATGSPFDPVVLGGKRFFPSQSNNMYVFPGIGLAASVSGVRRVTDKMLYRAACAIAESLTHEEKV